eukprot:847875-Amphidinium_carterae.1
MSLSLKLQFYKRFWKELLDEAENLDFSAMQGLQGPSSLADASIHESNHGVAPDASQADASGPEARVIKRCFDPHP